LFVVLSFLFGSSMVIVAVGAFGLMWVARRHSKFSKVTKWLVFCFALIAGSALALTFVGAWASSAMVWVLGLLGAPGALVGVVALIGAAVLVSDLVDGVPDGMARVQALILPTLLLATGGQLGVIGTEVTGAASSAGAALIASMVGGV
jgi:hypothetical protein